MKSRPILFSTPMVRALLDGRKTQTRRVIKRPLKHPGWTGYSYFPMSGIAIENGPDYPDDDSDQIRCPYGIAGDELWVKETWAWPGEEQVIYRADPETAELVERWKTDQNFPQVKWRPSIFMPRAHSRITLRITDVRVQQLLDITEAAAVAEGWPGPDPEMVTNGSPVISWYWRLWSDINGPESWASNPWVWVISFEVVNHGH